MTPRVVISMLALDGLEMSKACIESVIAHSPDPWSGFYQLVLTNNASTDGTKDYFDDLAEHWPHITVVHNQTNEIFHGPNNRVFELARQLGATYNITLNNDLVVPRGWLEKLEAEFDRNPRAAIVGPKGTITQMNTQMIGNSAGKLEFIEGSLACFKVSILEQFGPLFSNYLNWIYHEDSDASLRVKRAGYTIHQADFHVAHRNGSTCTRHPDAVRRCREANAANQRVMLQKWAHWNKVRRFDFPIVLRRRFASGDILLMTPIIRALKELWPLCPIDVECGAPEILRGNPLVRRCAKIIPTDPHAMVINLDGSYEKTPQRHVLESYAAVAGVDAAKVTPKLELYFSKTLSRPVGERWCAVHVGPTTWPGKNWPMDRWHQVIAWLAADGWKIRLFGNKDSIRWTVDDDQRGQNGVQGLAAMIAVCDLFVGLDSFPMHVSQAVGVPVVALFGITDPRCFMTKGDADAIAVCSAPEHVNTGRRNKLANVTFMPTDDSVMRTITVAQVLSAVTEITAAALSK